MKKDTLEKCQHLKLKTLNTVSWKAHKEGSPKFRGGFEEAERRGIRIRAARRKQCVKCGERITTVELSEDNYYRLLNPFDLQEQRLDQLSVNMGLSHTENLVKDYLIDVARKEVPTRYNGLATYKEVWNRVYPNRPWGRGNTQMVVEWVNAVSDWALDKGLPPLGALVVRVDTKKPGSYWVHWLNSNREAKRRYSDIQKAQQRCWEIWSNVSGGKAINAKMTWCSFGKERDYQQKDACSVILHEGSIMISYGDAIYKGERVGKGHYILSKQPGDGRATLHKIPYENVLEGSWEEYGQQGMWKIEW